MRNREGSDGEVELIGQRLFQSDSVHFWGEFEQRESIRAVVVRAFGNALVLTKVLPPPNGNCVRSETLIFANSVVGQTLDKLLEAGHPAL